MIRFRSTMALAVLALVGMVAMANAADPVVVAGACCDSGCENVCVRVPETRKVVKRVYTDVCEPLCLPKCSLLGHLFGHKDCGECGPCGECSQLTKKTLVVKLRTCEVPTTKCVVQPACAPGAPIK